MDHWSKHGPPVYIAVAAYMGLIKKEDTSSPVKDTGKSSAPGDLNDLLSMAGPGGMIF